MKVMRRTAGVAKWDHKKERGHFEVRIKLAVLHDQKYKRKWKEHMNRMNTRRMPKQILRYQPRGQRTMGLRVNRWEGNMRPQQATWPNRVFYT
jgi:hypothetical protein